MILFKSSFTLLLLVLFSCNSTQKTITDTEETNTKTELTMKTAEMVKAGYLSAEVVESKKEGDCPFTLKMINGEATYFLDPINISEDYKVNGEKIWVKFTPLRMMNRCENASPVSITEIEKRVE